MACTADLRQQARAAAEAIDADPRVAGIDVIDPETDPTNCWTIEATLVPEAGGVPAPVLADLASRGLTVRQVGPRNDHWAVVATV